MRGNIVFEMDYSAWKGVENGNADDLLIVA